MEKDLNDPLGKRIFQMVSRYTAPFLIIGDVANEDPRETMKIFENPESLEKKLLLAYNKRLKECRTKIKRSSIRSVISIFLSKVGLVLLIEIPFDVYITHKFSYIATGISLSVPPALMLFIVSNIHPPKPEITPQVIMESIKVVKGAERQESFEIRLSRKRGVRLNFILSFTSIGLSGLVFWLIIFNLLKIDFSVLSILIFLLFFCLIAFSGIKTGQWARELKIGQEKETVKSFILDLIFFPFIRVGRWLSSQIQRYNIFILLFNLVFEAPLQTFFEFLESWRGYIKEKKEEME